MSIETISLKRLLPSQVPSSCYLKLGLIELVSLGYGYHGTPEELLEQAQFEYEGDDNRCINYFAQLEDSIVGSLSLVRWFPTEPKRGIPFWKTLRERNPKLVENVINYYQEAVLVSGIVTHPDYRRRGIARMLVENACNEYNPFLVMGQTKFPEVVALFSSALSKHGFRTFFGYDEVTSETQFGRSNIHIDFIEAYLEGYKSDSDGFSEKLDVNGIRIWDPNRLSTDIPDVTTYPKYFQHAFEAGSRNIKSARHFQEPAFLFRLW